MQSGSLEIAVGKTDRMLQNRRHHLLPLSGVAPLGSSFRPPVQLSAVRLGRLELGAVSQHGRIAELYRIEAEIRGKSANERQVVRQEKTQPLVAALKTRLENTLIQLANGSSIAQAIRCGLNHWDGLARFLDDGCIEIGSDTVEPAFARLLCF